MPGSHKTLCLAKRKSVLSNFLPTLYIPPLPTKDNECFSERKPKQKHLRVRNCYSHNHLHIFSWFSSTPTSPSLHPWEVLSSKTYHTQSKCWVKFWCLWEAMEGAIKWRMQSSWIARFRKLVKTWLQEVHW